MKSLPSRHCKGCIYLMYLNRTTTNNYCCGYIIAEGKRRNCEPDICNKKLTKDNVDKKTLKRANRRLREGNYIC